MSIFGRRHSRLTGSDVGTIIWQEVADSAARLALSLISTDEGKVVKQTSDGSHWILDDYSGPTWRELTSVGVAAVTSVFGEVGDVTEADASFTAADIANVAAGNIVATDVQAALNELDTEKTPLTHTHVMSQIDDAGTVATKHTGVLVDTVPLLEDVGGSPGFAAGIDGSLLENLTASGSAIEVVDDTGGGGVTLTTDLTKWTLKGTGWSIVEPVEGEIEVTVAPGAAPVDSWGPAGSPRVGVIVPIASDYDASQVDNDSTVTGAFVDDALNTLDTDKAESTDARFPTTDEKGALAGTGIPSGSNLYVTADTLAAKTHAAADITSGTFPEARIGTDAIVEAKIQDDAVTYAKMQDGTPGGVIAYNTTTGEPVDIGVGTATQVLTSNASSVPSWEDNVGTGSAIEVVDDTGGGDVTLTTDLTKWTLKGTGWSIVEPVEGEIEVTVAPGAAPVDSWGPAGFPRVGVIVPIASDYDASQIDNDASDVNGNVTGAYVSNALDTADVAIESAQSDATQALADAAAAQSDATSAKTKTDYLSPLTGTIDMDQMDVDVAANNGKVTYDDAATVATNAGKLANVATTITAAGAALVEDASVPDQRTTLGLGTAAEYDVSLQIGDLVEFANVGGNPGFEAGIDGSLLENIPTGALTFVTLTDVDEADYVGHAGEFVKVNAGADGLDFGAVPGGGDMLASLNLSDVANTLTATQNLGVEVGVDVATYGHTHDTVANVATDRILGNVSAPGDSEELTGAQVRTLVAVSHGNILAGSLAELSGNITDRDLLADATKLDTVETAATADQTGAEIKAAYEVEANAFTDAQFTKLAGIDTGATDDQTGAEIKAAYEVEANAFTDAQFTKLAGIDTGAKDDQTGAEIKAAYEVEASAFTDAQFTKLAGIDTGATDDQTAGEIEAIVSHDNLLDFAAAEHRVIREDITANKGAASSYSGQYFYSTDDYTFERSDGSVWQSTGVTVDGVTLEVDVTNGLQLKDGGTIATDKLNTTGVADGTTFLRGDDTWSVPALPNELKTQLDARITDANLVSNITGEFVATTGIISTYDSTPATDDLILLEDGTTGAKKFTTIDDLPGGSEVNDLSATVTWANVPNANITEASVTQHEAALAIEGTQVGSVGPVTDGWVLTAVGDGSAAWEVGGGGGGPTTPGTTLDKGIAIYDVTDGTSLGYSPILVSESTSHGTHTLSGGALICGGIGTGVDFTATGNGSVTLAQAAESGGGTCTVTNSGALLFGDLTAASSGAATMTNASQGSIVGGSISQSGAGTAEISCGSSSRGAHAHGYVSGFGGTIKVTGTNTHGAHCSGYSFGGNLLASGEGSYVHGSGGFGIDLTASGKGSGMFGHATTDSSATAQNAFQFGTGLNPEISCLQVGNTTNGVRLVAGGAPTVTTTANGSIWVDGSGDTNISSSGGGVTTPVIFNYPDITGSRGGNAALASLLTALAAMNLITDSST